MSLLTSILAFTTLLAAKKPKDDDIVRNANGDIVLSVIPHPGWETDAAEESDLAAVIIDLKLDLEKVTDERDTERARFANLEARFMEQGRVVAEQNGELARRGDYIEEVNRQLMHAREENYRLRYSVPAIYAQQLGPGMGVPANQAAQVVQLGQMPAQGVMPLPARPASVDLRRAMLDQMERFCTCVPARADMLRPPTIRPVTD